MKRALVWSRNALADLEDVHDFIAADDPDRAQTWVDHLQARARRAETLAHSGRVVPEFGRDDVREFIVGNYRIVFQVARRQVVVLTVFERHRRLRAL